MHINANYLSDVESMAADIIEEHGHDHEAIYDAVHEWVDGSEWVIYTHRARMVLEFSSNKEAGPDELGWEGFAAGATGWADLYTRGAYYAMSADVMKKVHELLDDDAMEAVRERLYA